ncbi:MAG: MBL fold metallo-hydrolase [Bacteroidaceae bacterium]|nr:MBL fold metallo-hydrolase [Bacteroidaceae bacterium]
MLTVKTFPVNPLGENCYVVSDDTLEAVIIDCGALYDEEKAAISDYIDLQELRPVAHLLTHGHFDHLWGAAFLHERYGLAARCPEADLPLFNDAPGQMRAILGHAMSCPTGPAGDVITPESVIPFGNHQLTVISSPGHTPGGVCFYCESEHVLFSGDSLFQMSIGRTDFPGGNHWDLIRSLRRLLRDLPDDVTIYPGHGPRTNAAFERNNNPYLNLVPED